MDSSSSPQVKFLKGAEEKQVEQNVLVTTVVGVYPSTNGTQHTVEEQLGRTNYILSGSNSDAATS